MNITLVYNPKSGSSLSRQALRKKCDAANITIDKFVAIGDGFERKLSSAITAGASIAVIGGDGTVSAVAGLVANTKATLIPLPGGTLNHFTKDLDIPQDVDEALARLRRLKPRTIDIASVNDMMFINNSSIGLYPASLRSREKLESKLSKWSAAVVASWRAFVNLQTYRVAHTETIPLDSVNMRRALAVYGSGDGLNIMTCAGQFVPSRNTYDHRLIVYAIAV